MLKRIIEKNEYDNSCKKCDKTRLACVCPEGFTNKAPVISILGRDENTSKTNLRT